MDECLVDEGKFVIPCSKLMDVVDTGGKGVCKWEYFNTETHKPTRSFFGVKSGKYKKEGFLFNFCPFCGVNISAPFNKENE